MKRAITTVVTKRGQVSLPAFLRRELGLRSGDRLRWQKVSRVEIRATLARSSKVAGPLAMLGYACRFMPKGRFNTDAYLREMREGERR